MDSETESGALWGWASTFQNIKEKSSTIIQAYKKDLEEFAKTLQDDTTEVLKPIGEQVVSALSIDNESGDIANPKDNISCTDYSTLAVDPVDQEFATFISSFDAGAKADEIAIELSRSPALQAFHCANVPSSIPFSTFWGRYFYMRSNKLAHRVLNTTETDTSDKEDELAWDVDEDVGEDLPKRCSLPGMDAIEAMSPCPVSENSHEHLKGRQETAQQELHQAQLENHDLRMENKGLKAQVQQLTEDLHRHQAQIEELLSRLQLLEQVPAAHGAPASNTSSGPIPQCANVAWEPSQVAAERSISSSEEPTEADWGDWD
eukprot:GILK01006350.1.p1 GENE.GILK01006350.1~~GILK01006350.1.p1  ORF type:complete len:318 (+),score=53.71 GILK01006350.1:42-995(+)